MHLKKFVKVTQVIPCKENHIFSVYFLDVNQRSINVSIEKWLKTKFREGFKELQKSFKEQDPKGLGRIKRKGKFKNVRNNLFLNQEY